jgi:peptidoglycan/xylan/chitin deacetylase (PgdA/CDA1 family)
MLQRTGANAVSSQGTLKTVKNSLYALAEMAGGTAWVRDSRWRRRRLLILCYHGISLEDEHQWNPELYVSPERFRERMQVLISDGYSVLPLGEAVSRLYAGELPDRAVAITFDDGNYDFFRQALPVLSSHRFPATVYLTTYYCYDQRPVFDPACSYLLWKGRSKVLDLGWILPGAEEVALSGTAARAMVVKRLRQLADSERYSTDDKHQLLQQLAERVAVDWQALLAKRILHIMSPDEVRQLPDRIHVELHTHRHRTPLDRSLFHREIHGNRTAITDLRSWHCPQHFCYPSNHYVRDFLPWLSESGVVTATTCNPGLASTRTNPLLLPRLVDTMNISEIEFASWLAGLAAWLPRRAPPRVGYIRKT